MYHHFSLSPRWPCVSALWLSQTTAGPLGALIASLFPLLASVTCKVWAQPEVWEETEETQRCLELVEVLLLSRKKAPSDPKTHLGHQYESVGIMQRPRSHMRE